MSQLWPDKSQPDVASHSHSWAEPCGWAARMILEVFLYIRFDYSGKFFNCERGHIQKTRAMNSADVERYVVPDKTSAEIYAKPCAHVAICEDLRLCGNNSIGQYKS